METFSEEGFWKLLSVVTPIHTNDGYLFKRDDEFLLNGISGGKVRQCLKLVYDNLSHIRENCSSTIITASGLPSPQSAIVSCIAHYFGLKCIVVVPRYENHVVDYNRINVSIAQSFGAKVYGVGNPNPSGPEKDVKEMCKRHGYYQVKFAMNGNHVTDTNANQAENLPDYLESITCISGSGLSALSLLRGIKRYGKRVDRVNIIGLSDYFLENKQKWYDVLPASEQYDGEVRFIRSEIPYQTLYRFRDSMEFDLTYESKGVKWMYENVSPNGKNLFWVVGIRNYDLDRVVPIAWHRSEYEQDLDLKRSRKSIKIKREYW